jgi:SIR2-like domain
MSDELDDLITGEMGEVDSGYFGEFDFDEASRRDPEGSRRRMVLLGAGASVEAGLPAASELHEELVSQVGTYKTISHALVSEDVERILRVLATLAEAGEQDSLGYDLNRLDAFRELLGFIGVGTLAEGLQKATEAVDAVLDHVRQRYWLEQWQSDRAEYLRPLVEAQRGGTIATLNYDNSLLRVDADEWDYWEQDVEIPPEHAWRVRLLPLHGALEWEHRFDPGHNIDRIVKRPEWQNPGNLDLPYRPGIVLGAGNKLRSFGPFLSLLHEFETALSQSRTLIVLGYSWRDRHINDLIRKWATSDARARREDLARDRMPDSHGRLRLIVGTGPANGQLAPAVQHLRLHHSDDVDIRPAPGLCSDVICRLFGESGEFAESHLGTEKMPWCSG